MSFMGSGLKVISLHVHNNLAAREEEYSKWVEQLLSLNKVKNKRVNPFG